MSARVGIGYDSHRFAEGRPLVLGGVEVPGAERGLAGWSDADALTHAVIDALLGAAGLGDIGARYPDTDERWRGSDSIALLADTAAAVAGAGLAVVNVDATLVCEAPRLGPHRDAMRARLAAALAAPPERVGVKFTTNEGMGFVGRGEGVAAIAVAALEPAGIAPRPARVGPPSI
ncbi:MAG: 2-C-methyl-D-erythritol 2,4-cyclodiphosphate synthase [Nocardioidaceae bacterium]